LIPQDLEWSMDRPQPVNLVMNLGQGIVPHDISCLLNVV
jgi:hypothetical protein